MMQTRAATDLSVIRRLDTEQGRLGWVAIVPAASLVVVLLGIAVAPERAWPNVLLSAVYFIGLGLAALAFLAFLHVTSAGWAVCFKRVIEAVASTLPAPSRCGASPAQRPMWTHGQGRYASLT